MSTSSPLPEYYERRFVSSLQRLHFEPWMRNISPARPLKKSAHDNDDGHGQRPLQQQYYQRPRYRPRSAAATVNPSSSWHPSNRCTSYPTRWSSSTLNGGGGSRDSSSSIESLPVTTQHQQNYQHYPRTTSPAPSCYLGWRSTENVGGHSLLHTPAERLALSLRQPKKPDPFANDPKKRRYHQDVPKTTSFPSGGIHDSIRSVTSAIMDFCCEENDVDGLMTTPQKPKNKLIWMESSFVSTHSSSS